jgi:hypothetical protein
MILDTNTEIPRPWVIAHKIQDAGLQKLDGNHEFKGIVEIEGDIPPALPKISAPAAWGIMAMLSGNISLPTLVLSKDGDGSETETQELELSEEENQRAEQMQKSSEALMKDLEEIAKIIDVKDGKTIGHINPAPAPGTSVLLAQMRLDEVGLLDSEDRKFSMKLEMVKNNIDFFHTCQYGGLRWTARQERQR